MQKKLSIALIITIFLVFINRGVPKNIVMLFYKWISSLSFCVLWNNILSSACNISSDLLQGNILSPKFFNAYIHG